MAKPVLMAVDDQAQDREMIRHRFMKVQLEILPQHVGAILREPETLQVDRILPRDQTRL